MTAKKEPPIKELSKKNKAGAKLKLNEQMIKDISNGIALGFTIKETCEMVGIGLETFFDWRRTGKRDTDNGVNSIFSEFSESLKKAKTKILKAMLSKIVMAADEDWKAAAWYCERNFPEKFSLNPELRNKKSSKKKSVEMDADEIINSLNEKL